MHCSVLTGERKPTYSAEWGKCWGGGGGGYLTNIWVWVSRWGFNTLTLFRAKRFLKYMPCLGQPWRRKDKMEAILKLVTVVEQIHVKVIALYTWTTNKIHLANQINPCRQYPVDWLTRNCIPSLEQTHTRLYTLFRTERSKTIPCPEARPLMGYNNNEVPPGGGCVVSSNPVQQTL